MGPEFPVVLRFQHPVIQVSLSSDIAITSSSLNFLLYLERRTNANLGRIRDASIFPTLVPFYISVFCVKNDLAGSVCPTLRIEMTSWTYTYAH